MKYDQPRYLKNWDGKRLKLFLKSGYIMIFKALRGETPDYLLDLFVPSHNDVYQLRSNDRKLYMKKPIQTS